jgi:hypothetical protein
VQTIAWRVLKRRQTPGAFHFCSCVACLRKQTLGTCHSCSCVACPRKQTLGVCHSCSCVACPRKQSLCACHSCSCVAWLRKQTLGACHSSSYVTYLTKQTSHRCMPLLFLHGHLLFPRVHFCSPAYHSHVRLCPFPSQHFTRVHFSRASYPSVRRHYSARRPYFHSFCFPPADNQPVVKGRVGKVITKTAATSKTRWGWNQSVRIRWRVRPVQCRCDCVGTCGLACPVVQPLGLWVSW